MSDTPRTRIAAVLYRQHYRYGNPNGITWDELETDLKDRYLADADAVIAELGLREEIKYPGGFSFMPPARRRYVTDWEITDE